MKNLKNTAIIIVLLSVSLFPSNCKKEDGQSYSSVRHGFSITFPKGWEIADKDEIGGDTIVAAFRPKTEKENVFRENIQITSVILKGDLTLESYNSYFISTLSEKLPNFHEFSNGDETINGLDSKWHIFSYSLKDEKRKAYYSFIGEENTLYLIICTAKPDTFETYKNIFEKTIESFRAD